MAAGPADKALDVFKSMVFDPLVNSAIASIIALAPWLALPPITFLVRRVVSFIANRIYAALGETINLQVILLNNAAHHAAYVDATIDLKHIARDKGVDSVEFRKARLAHQESLAKFVRYSGT